MIGLALALLLVALLLTYNRQELLKVIKEREERLDLTTREMVRLEEKKNELLVLLQKQEAATKTLQIDVDKQKELTSTILSQKKSSETRLGQISENLVPFLDGFPYDPKTAHFLGNPIDYIIFDIYSSDPSIVFLEVKTGNSKLSSNQKVIKNLIKSGKVKFEEIRLAQKGVKLKGTVNEQ